MIIGRKVKLKNYPEYITGTLSDYDPETEKYFVQYTRHDLVPPGDWYAEEELEVLNGYQAQVNPHLENELSENKCECGQSEEEWVKHSHWCKLYKE